MKPVSEYGRKMRKIAEQKANSFCYLVHWIDTGDIWGPFLYREENATQEFVRRIDMELVEINKVLAIKHNWIITEEDKKKFAKTDTCWICKEKLAIDDNVWVYCHIKGKFREPAHNTCNLNPQIEAWKTPIPVVF